MAIGITIHGHRAQPKITARANDTYRDLPPIGNQYFLKWPGSRRKSLHKASYGYWFSPLQYYSTCTRVVGADLSRQIHINLTRSLGKRVGAGVVWMWGEGPCGRPLLGY